LVAADNSGAASVLLGSGSGAFGPKTDYPAGSATSGVVVADFNGDGKLDLATSNQNGNDVSVLLGNGRGTFQTQVTYAAGMLLSPGRQETSTWMASRTWPSPITPTAR
jgi:hypothetical protein